ncbi:MAG: alanyl-tRNA editing protein [Candidatus Aenigmarchaeota archaeon]|nr:alanyl-tRNA editing protein [Candidatus Aenigmarchaeota archaeon]
MNTKLLHMEDCYLKEFDAKIINRGDNYVVLDQTAFYPLGGGQPSDQGTLNGIKVTEVRKENGEVRHFLEKPVEGEEVHGVLDWERRYAFMRMHTAQHLLSGIVIGMKGSETAGNQIGRDYSRIDFRPFRPDEKEVELIAGKFNEWVDKQVPVKIYFSTRKKVMEEVDEKRRVLFSRLPEFIKEIRVVEIEGIDRVPCGGAHVANTKEIGHINIIRTENKGSDTTRMVFGLE